VKYLLKDNIGPLFIIVGVWALTWALIMLTVPLLPVDETRYMTVAWEMRVRGEWILPTLNFAAYSHKPPLLFWFINLVWNVTGDPAVWSARIVPLLVSAGVLCGTFAFARRLFPERKNMPALAALTLAASPMFYVYGGLIMFDMMISLIALCAALSVWRAAESGQYRWLLLWGVAVGLGVLAKGPVILVYTIFPVLLAPLWQRPQLLVKWYGAMMAGIFIAAVIGLSWAIPAAMFGGPEYAQMIFWKQSAGRVVSAFAHQRTVLFYLPFLLVIFLPLTLWPSWWRVMRTGARDIAGSTAGRFLLCWVVPSLICLLLISGKQAHYLIPLLPGTAIFFAAVMDKHLRSMVACVPFIVFGVLLLVLLAAPFVGSYLPFVQGDEFARTIVESFNPFVSLAALVATGVLYMLSRQAGDIKKLFCLSLLVVVFFMHFQIQTAQRAFAYYDLVPAAHAAQDHKDRPFVFVRNYKGEVGFLARMTKPIDSLTSLAELPEWFGDHANGVALVRFKRDSDIENYRVLFRAPYRCATKFMALVEMKQKP